MFSTFKFTNQTVDFKQIVEQFVNVGVLFYIQFSIKTIKLYYNLLILIFDYVNKELSLLMSNKN